MSLSIVSMYYGLVTFWINNFAIVSVSKDVAGTPQKRSVPYISDSKVFLEGCQMWSMMKKKSTSLMYNPPG